jgi:rhamnosyltransferase
MKILGHIHSLNDEEVIDRSLEALLEQSYPVQEIVLVDNGSTDGTLERSFPNLVQIIRHSHNLGTSGAVISGMKYALDHEFEWIWLFDADSAPNKNALEKLIALYLSFPPDLQNQIWLMAGLLVEFETKRPYHAFSLKSKRLREIRPNPEQLFYEFEATMWSGSLYKLSAVRKVGYPVADYVLDIGEVEYGYRGTRFGYRAFLHRGSLIDHNIRGQPSRPLTSYRFGPFSFRMIELRPIRCYYLVRNHVYFWLYQYYGGNLYTFAYCFGKVAKIMASFILRQGTHRKELSACVKGIWDGLFKNMHHRY